MLTFKQERARANAIVRILVDNYKVDPLRVIASGHSYYDPMGVIKPRKDEHKTGEQ